MSKAKKRAAGHAWPYDTWLDKIELTGEPDSPTCQIYGKTERVELALIAICSHISPESISMRSAEIWRVVLKQPPPDIRLNSRPAPQKTDEQPIEKARIPGPGAPAAARANLAAADRGLS